MVTHKASNKGAGLPASLILTPFSLSMSPKHEVWEVRSLRPQL